MVYTLLMALQTIVLLIVAGIFGLIYLWFLFALVYHLIRFGIGLLPKVLALVFFLGSFLLFALIIILFLN
ncbi:hypothetical protein FJ208_01960, partial [Candidatus Gribaldobacteria bacterium]|nr:hypothetical protein [Candidatus Gribaldobacteria bacterium]